jgi:hypothetical protein
MFCVDVGTRDTLNEVMQLLVTWATGGTNKSGDDSQRPVLVVCGTGYIMPEARAFVGIVEPRYSARCVT